MAMHLGDIRTGVKERTSASYPRRVAATGLRAGRAVSIATRRGLSITTTWLSRVVWLLVGLLDAVLALDFVFRLIGSSDTGVVGGVYRVGSTVASPFAGIFAGLPHSGAYVLTWSDAAAAVAVTIVGWTVAWLVAAPARRFRRIS
jgi:hypothetical protein